MYPADQLYSYRAFNAWRKDKFAELRPFRQKASEILNTEWWVVRDWDSLRMAVSFLTLMNKRSVLYFRGQGSHHDECLPVLFRSSWRLAGKDYNLNSENRGKYYAATRELQDHVFAVAAEVGTPRYYMLEHYPPAAAAILQHYELWPTHMIDVTRSLSIAIAFATAKGQADSACLYAFSLPDLRGSITTDMDQHLSISRLEAICPPDAKRPHHQDAYLVGRIPEPPGDCHPGQKRWNDWQKGSNLMYRLCAKFTLKLRDGQLPGAPPVSLEYLLPQPSQDVFGERLYQEVQPIAAVLATAIDA